MINEKISLRTWIEDAADQGVPLHTYLLKLSSEELELSEDAILEQMQTMLQVMEESAAFGLTGVLLKSCRRPDSLKIIKIF